MNKQSSRKFGRQKTQSSRLSGGYNRDSGVLHQSTASLNEEAPKVKSAFYQNFFFWMILLIILIVAPWLYFYINNEGCPEYTIIETLQLEQFLGKWYVQYESNLENDEDLDDQHCGMLNIQTKKDSYGGDSFVIHTANSHTYSPAGQKPMSQQTTGKLRWPHPPYGHLQQKATSFEGWNNFDIMETDYVNYAVMYQCQPRWLGASTYEKMWVLVRQPTPIDSNLWREYKKVSFQAISRGFINSTIGKQFATESVMTAKKQGVSICKYPGDEDEKSVE